METLSQHIKQENLESTDDNSNTSDYGTTQTQGSVVKEEVDDCKISSEPCMTNKLKSCSEYSTSSKSVSEEDDYTFECNNYGNKMLLLPKPSRQESIGNSVQAARGKKSHGCEFCEKVFITKWGLKKHLFLHTLGKGFKCATCNRNYSGMTTLKNHLQQHQMAELKPYKCLMCNKSFRDKKVVRNHVCLHILAPYTCYICNNGKKFSSKISLRGHHLQVHGEEKPYKCDTCGFAFSQKSKLARHVLVHSEARPFKCPDCGKSFREEKSLQLHSYMHQDEKPFKCQVCKKGFSDKVTVAKHQVVHATERPFKCDECAKSFCTQYRLRSHQQTHSKVLPFKCAICGKTFKIQRYLRRHQAKHKENKR